jgi:hypothetical protein
MLEEVIQLFSSAADVARFTECDMPKSSAWMMSSRAFAGPWSKLFVFMITCSSSLSPASDAIRGTHSSSSDAG